MNLMKYQAECQNTKSNKFFGERVSKLFFANAVMTAIEALNRLDAIKKSLFYGKDSKNYPVNGEAHANVDSVETCVALQIHRLHDFPQPGLDILHAIIGKATESAELLELLLKSVINNEPFDRVNFIEEIGDGFWYDGIGLEAVSSNFHDAAGRNNRKLKRRFPDKFKTDDAITRDLDAERAELEDKAIDRLESTFQTVDDIADGKAIGVTAACGRDNESAAGMLQRLGTDADLWAREFAKLNTVDIAQAITDEGKVDILRAWFANAIEAGRSQGIDQMKDAGIAALTESQSERIAEENAG